MNRAGRAEFARQRLPLAARAQYINDGGKDLSGSLLVAIVKKRLDLPGLLKGFISKQGKPFEAYLTLGEETDWKANFRFESGR